MEFSVREQPYDYEWRIGGQEWDTVVLRKHNLRAVFEGMTEDEAFTALREGMGPGDLPAVGQWAEELEMKELAKTIRRVNQLFERPYIVFFAYQGTIGNQATIVAFTEAGKKRGYNVEYTIPDHRHETLTDTILRLYRNEYGDWDLLKKAAEPA